MRNRINWTLVDWGQQDVVLAIQLGCSRERVRQVRQAMGKLKAEAHRKRTRGTACSRLAKEATEIATLPKLSELAGCKEGTVRAVLKKLGKGYRMRPNGRARYAWDRFPAGWRSMTDKAIGAIVGVRNPAIVAQYRKRHGYLRSLPKVKGELMYP